MLFDVGNGVSESCLPGSPGIPRNPPAGKSVHPVADIAGAGTTPAVQCNKAAFAPRNAAAVRLVRPGDRLPAADTGTAKGTAKGSVSHAQGRHCFCFIRRRGVCLVNLISFYLFIW